MTKSTPDSSISILTLFHRPYVCINIMPWSTITLNDGRKIPQIGFGSAGHSLETTPDVIDTALDVGFDHIDTAQSKLYEPE
jgi:hypothetical protein